jgi:hypothetical protein
VKRDLRRQGGTYALTGARKDTPMTVTEQDYSEFHGRIENYVAEVEAHLGLPAGTVGLVGTSSDSDFVFVLKMCGVVEP